MILIFVVWLYITVVCIGWGTIAWRTICKLSDLSPQALGLPAVCITGLITVGTIAFSLNFFLPLGLLAHIGLLIPVIIFFLLPKNRHALYKQWVTYKKDFSMLNLLLLVPGILLILSLNASRIVHADTLLYQGQAIKWVETYKAVPGIAHVISALGFKSMWFAAHAVFRFDFIEQHHFLFLNGCVACWFLLFVLNKVAFYYKAIQNNRASPRKLFAWILLLLYVLVPLTHLRLFAASASTDFMAGLLIWSALYVFYRHGAEKNAAYDLLATLFAFAAVTVKLSAIPVLLLPVCLVFRWVAAGKWKTTVYIVAGGLLLLIPLVMHNIIASGYPLFPSAAFNLLEVDWKYPMSELHQLQDFIAVYARYPVGKSPANEQMLQLPFYIWVYQWWHHLPVAEKVFISLIVLLLFFNLFAIKKVIRVFGQNDLIVLVVAVAGSLFWFVQAPAPRFGAGFLIPLAYMLLIGLHALQPISIRMIAPFFISMIVWAVPVFITGYVAYRGIKFSLFNQLVTPAGVNKTAHVQLPCQGVTMYQVKKYSCSFSPVPCVGFSCNHFTLRGKKIDDGFKGK
jgi:hypothetical protein